VGEEREKACEERARGLGKRKEDIVPIPPNKEREKRGKRKESTGRSTKGRKEGGPPEKSKMRRYEEWIEPRRRPRES